MAKDRAVRGTVEIKHGAWYWRHYVNGKQKWTKLADKDDNCRTRSEAIKLANQIAAQERTPAAVTARMAVVEFAEQTYLPWVKEQKRPATYDGYRKLWAGHLRGHFAKLNMRLCDYEPHHATTFLTGLAKRMGKHSIRHARALMSGLFAHAVALGHLRMNPIHDARVLAKPALTAPTAHYTLEEITAILLALRSEPRAWVAMALSFLGLRTSEIAGLHWEDVDLADGVLQIRRSVWHGQAFDCKTEKSRREVTLGPTVTAILANYRERGTFVSGYVLENSAGKPMDLGIFAARKIRPILDKLGLEWKGYYAGRRGSETEMNRHTNGNSQITSHHFGHSKQVADMHYIKPLPDETRKAALALDAALGECIKGNERQQETEPLVSH